MKEAATPRRVLMTADPIGGVWTYALELAAALAPHRIEVALATMGRSLTDEERSEVGRLNNVRLFESEYRLEWMDQPWNDVDLAGEWLRQVAAEFGAELIHLNGYSQAALGWNQPVVVVAHSCVRSWWRAVHGGAAPAGYDEYSERVAVGLRAADAVIAPSHAMLGCIEQEYRFAAAGRVIPNAIRHDLFAPAPKRPVIFASGRIWDAAKNLRSLDRIAGRLSWPVEIAGESHHPNGQMEELRAARSLGKLSRAALAAQLAEAAIYVLPARYEPFGLSALEAGLSDCALVLGDIPSLREIWDGAAVFVAPEDEAALASELGALIADSPRREELGLRARARAVEFTPEKMAGSYLDVYRDCMARKLEEAAA